MKFKRGIILLIVILLLSSVTAYATVTNIATTDLRYWGQGRYDTSFAVADELYRLKGKYDNVIVAYGGNFPDALSGGYLAKVRNAPILLVDQARESKVTQYISKYMKSTGTVYILGGTGVVRKQYETTLKNKGFKVKRLAGATAMDTNLEILKNCAKGADTLLIATKNHFADSLSASSVGLPIMLVNKNLTANQKTWLKSSGIKKFCILGGTGAVPNSIATELKAYGTVSRCWGQSRYDTSYEIAKKFFPNANTITLVYGMNYPDGLSGAPLAMYYNSPIVLVDTKNWKNAHRYVFDKDIFKSITIGGTAVVTKDTVYNVMNRYRELDNSKPTWTWTGYTKATATKITYSLKGNIPNLSKNVKETENATITSKITKKATCTATGTKTYTATVSFVGGSYTDTKTETIAKLGHKYGAWTKLNNTQHQRICSNDKTHIEKANHTWDSGKITTAATETSTGVKTYTCTACKATKTEIIPKLAHTHSWGSWTTVNNQHIRTCTRNNCTSIDKHSPSWDKGKVTQEPTSTTEGEYTYTCTKCNQTKTEPIPIGHIHTFNDNWEYNDNTHWHESTCGHDVTSSPVKHTLTTTTTVAATCTADGKTITTCSTCGYTKITVIPKVSHTLSPTPAKAATCTTTGNKEYWTCSVCRGVFSDSAGKNPTTVNAMTIAVLGHNYATTWTSNDTQHWHKCTRSGCNFTSGAANHKWETVTQATCTSSGSEKCSTCGKTRTTTASHTWKTINYGDKDTHYVGDYFDHKAKKHFSYPPTHDTAGLSVKECTKCGETSTTTIPKLTTHVHEWDWLYDWNRDTWKYDSTKHWRECTKAGCNRTNYEFEHIYEQWEITKEPTATTVGQMQRKCYYCNYIQTKSIAKGHAHTWTHKKTKYYPVAVNVNFETDVYVSPHKIDYWCECGHEARTDKINKVLDGVELNCDWYYWHTKASERAIVRDEGITAIKGKKYVNIRSTYIGIYNKYCGVMHCRTYNGNHEYHYELYPENKVLHWFEVLGSWEHERDECSGCKATKNNKTNNYDIFVANSGTGVEYPYK